MKKEKLFEKVEIDILNKIIHCFCKSCKDNKDCVGSNRLTDNFAYKYRYDGCKRKIRFVDMLDD